MGLVILIALLTSGPVHAAENDQPLRVAAVTTVRDFNIESCNKKVCYEVRGDIANQGIMGLKYLNHVIVRSRALKEGSRWSNVASGDDVIYNPFNETLAIRGPDAGQAEILIDLKTGDIVRLSRIRVFDVKKNESRSF